MSAAFSSNAEAVITRPLDLAEQEKRTGIQRKEADLSIAEFYDIDRTSSEIQSRLLKRIALQFPDEMLRDSVSVYLSLGAALRSKGYVDFNLFVLADTSYGSCCVDEVAAQHVNADAVVHYGHACLSPTTRLPTIYVYGRRKVDPERVATSFASACAELSPKSITLRMDVSCCYAADDIIKALQLRLSDMHISYSQLPGFQAALETWRSDETQSSHEPSAETGTILFVGPETLALTNLMITHGNYQVFRYDPASDTCSLESVRTNKLLMRRYTMVQRARDADVFGILVGTLGVASYLHLIKQLRQVLTQKGKKTYTISVGKLNPAKLANFAEIECFILVACPENSLIESKEYFRPIVTPFELQIALGVTSTWDGRYLLDFDKVLKDTGNGSIQDGADAEDEPEFSLITGKYRRVKNYGDRLTEDTTGQEKSALVSRNQQNTIAKMETAAGEFLNNRSWQGLEQNLGMDEPAILEKGRMGIAKGYREVDHAPENDVP